MRYTGTGASVRRQLVAGAKILAEFDEFARSLGCFIHDDEIACTPMQGIALDAWWDERTRKSPTPERCNCDASCGENRHHDKYRPGCRYYCEDCERGAAHSFCRRING